MAGAVDLAPHPVREVGGDQPGRNRRATAGADVSGTGDWSTPGASPLAALPVGRIGGAAPDVFENEPMSTPATARGPELRPHPHIADAGEATRGAIGPLAVDNVEALFAGRPALSPAR